MKFLKWCPNLFLHRRDPAIQLWSPVTSQLRFFCNVDVTDTGCNGILQECIEMHRYAHYFSADKPPPAGKTLLFGRAYTRYLVIALQAYFNKAKIAAFGSALLPHINESGGNEKRQVRNVMTNVLWKADTLVLFYVILYLLQDKQCERREGERSFLEINTNEILLSYFRAYDWISAKDTDCTFCFVVYL